MPPPRSTRTGSPKCLDARITRLYPCGVRDSWEIRFEWIQTILVWVALVVGVGLFVVHLLVFGELRCHRQEPPGPSLDEVVHGADRREEHHASSFPVIPARRRSKG